MPAIMPQLTKELSECANADEFKDKINKYVMPHVKDVQVNGSEILIATYIERNKTKGGLLKGDRTVQESLYQGSVGIILATGPLAFKFDNSGFKWGGVKPTVGDWVLVRFADCLECHIVGCSCRFVDHQSIHAVLENPEIITSERERPEATLLTRALSA